MKRPRFSSAARRVLDAVGQELMWFGLWLSPSGLWSGTAGADLTRPRRGTQPASCDVPVPAYPNHCPDQQATPLSDAEQAAWASLVERLRS